MYVIFDYVMKGYVSKVRKNGYSTSRYCCDALVFSTLRLAKSFVYILEQLYSDTHFGIVSC